MPFPRAWAGALLLTLPWTALAAPAERPEVTAAAAKLGGTLRA